MFASLSQPNRGLELFNNKQAAILIDKEQSLVTEGYIRQIFPNSSDIINRHIIFFSSLDNAFSNIKSQFISTWSNRSKQINILQIIIQLLKSQQPHIMTCLHHDTFIMILYTNLKLTLKQNSSKSKRDYIALIILILQLLQQKYNESIFTLKHTKSIRDSHVVLWQLFNDYMDRSDVKNGVLYLLCILLTTQKTRLLALEIKDYFHCDNIYQSLLHEVKTYHQTLSDLKNIQNIIYFIYQLCKFKIINFDSILMTNYDVIYSIIIQTITTLTTIKHDATKDDICQNIMKLQSSIIETKDTPNFFQQLNKIGIFEEFIKITLTNRITRISIITLISNILCIDSNKVDIMIYSQYFDQIWRTDLTVRNSATVLFQMIKLLKSSKSHYDLIATDEQALLFIYQQLSKEQHTNTKFALICIQEILQKHKSGECKLILYNNGAIINAICQKTYNIGHPYNIGPLVAVFVLLSHKINDKRIELKELKIIKEILIQNEITKIWVNLKKNKYIDLQPIVIHHFELIIKYCSTK